MCPGCPPGCSPSVTETVWVGEGFLSAKFRLDFCSRHLRGSGVDAAGQLPPAARAVFQKCRLRPYPELLSDLPAIVGRGSREGAAVRVDLDELVEHWTLLEDERELIAGKRGPTRLGFAVLLKFYARAGRFPRGRAELDDDAVAFVARQVGVPPPPRVLRVGGQHDRVPPGADPPPLGFRECTAEDARQAHRVAGCQRLPGRAAGRPGAGGAAGPVPRRADRAAVGGPVRPDRPLGAAPGRAGADRAGDWPARPERQRAAGCAATPPTTTRRKASRRRWR